jgi:flagellar biosynthesis/type III secretory pathway protein FliH
MEKTIKLIMENDKTLKIYINKEEKYIIEAQKRSITAEKIYEIMDFSIGDHYSIVSENEGNVDAQVLDFFTELCKEIIEKVNALNQNEDVH